MLLSLTTFLLIILLVKFESISSQEASAIGSKCENTNECQTSPGNSLVCYKLTLLDEYGTCACIYPNILGFDVGTHTWECLLPKAIYSEACIYNKSDDYDQCTLTDKHLHCDHDGICKCEDNYKYDNSTGLCIDKYDDYNYTISATVAVGMACVVLVLIIVLLILIFLHRNAVNERRLNYLRSQMVIRPANTENVQMVNMFKDSPPPSYNEIERCETPPPAFETLDSLDCVSIGAESKSLDLTTYVNTTDNQ